MEEKSLSIAFSDSLKDDSVAFVSDLAEIGLDAIMDDGVLKEVPILSTAVALYKIGNSIKERHNIKKLIAFINEINNEIADEQKRQEYQQRFQNNENFRNRELEYLLVLIDRYISYDKPRMLAKLYMAYLDEKIIWGEFLMYAEVVDRFLLIDVNTLTQDSELFIVRRNIGGESILRLVALGLMTDITNTSPFEEHGNGNIGMTLETLKRSQSVDKTYKRTEFGEKLANILRDGI